MNKYSLGKQKTLAELCVHKDEHIEELQAKYAAVVAELECAQNDIELRDREIAALKQKVDEAVAKCAAMDDVLLEAACAPTNKEACTIASEAYDLTDKQALAKLKADAIREALESIGTRWSSDMGEEVIRLDVLESYIDQLEQGK